MNAYINSAQVSRIGLWCIRDLGGGTGGTLFGISRDGYYFQIVTARRVQRFVQKAIQVKEVK